ncbi:MAG: hypothetical protein H6Q39_1062, partial [Chloroflexi bacterium]|nr:hypothetical protein [Chloroflexota bacterium]
MILGAASLTEPWPFGIWWVHWLVMAVIILV